jgi:hypothetical protein
MRPIVRGICAAYRVFRFERHRHKAFLCPHVPNCEEPGAGEDPRIHLPRTRVNWGKEKGHTHLDEPHKTKHAEEWSVLRMAGSHHNPTRLHGCFEGGKVRFIRRHGTPWEGRDDHPKRAGTGG